MNWRPDSDDRRVWKLAWPIIVSNLSVPLVGMVDAAVVGRLGEPAYIGAIALGAMLFSLLYWSFGFLRMGTTGFIAQSAGANDGHAMRLHVVRSIALATVLSLIILALQKSVLEVALNVLDGSQRVESLTATYFEIRVLSAPAVLLQYVAMGVLIGLGNTKAVLIVQLLLNLGNVVLDLFFVSVLGYDVDGVAWATIIAETLSTIVALWLMLKTIRQYDGRWMSQRLYDRSAWLSMFRVNSNLFVRTVFVISVSMLFTVLGTRMGDAMLAANYILMTMVHVLSHGLDGFAHAAEVLTGEAFGRRSREAFNQVVRSSTRLAAITAAGFTLLWIVGGVPVINAMTDLTEIRVLAYEHLVWVIATPLIAVWSYQLDGIYIGTTHTREMRDGMIISFLAFLVSCWLLIQLFGNHGLWAAMMVFYLARAYTLYRWFPNIERAFGDVENPDTSDVR